MLACDVCGKCMTDPATGAATVAMMLAVSGETEQKAEAEFLQRQLGPYEQGRKYVICYECMLRAIGVKAGRTSKKAAKPKKGNK